MVIKQNCNIKRGSLHETPNTTDDAERQAFIVYQMDLYKKYIVIFIEVYKNTTFTFYNDQKTLKLSEDKYICTETFNVSVTNIKHPSVTCDTFVELQVVTDFAKDRADFGANMTPAIFVTLTPENTIRQAEMLELYLRNTKYTYTSQKTPREPVEDISQLSSTTQRLGGDALLEVYYGTNYQSFKKAKIQSAHKLFRDKYDIIMRHMQNLTNKILYK